MRMLPPARGRAGSSATASPGSAHCSSGRLAGFVHAVWDGGTHTFILGTMVHPDFQHLGIGCDLVRMVTGEAFTARCDWVHVDYEPELAREAPARPT